MPINSFLYPGAKFSPAYVVDNSCRFNDDDSAYMNKSFGTSSNEKKWTYSCWFKRGNLGINTRLIQNYVDGNNRGYVMLEAADTLFIFIKGGGTDQLQWRSTQLFRDVGAWYHLHIKADSTESSQDDRFRVYVNGTEVTAWTKTTQPSLNIDWGFNADSATSYIGSSETPSDYWDGYMSEVVMLDGQVSAVTNFGEFDEDSPTIWKPKDVSGLTFGTNGFYLDFEDSSNLGNDANGGTDFTENNLAATDQSSDSPTNNWCTLSNITPSSNNNREGNLLHYNNSGGHDMRIGTIAVTTGKWYAELKAVQVGGDYPQLGIINPDKFDDYNYLGKSDAGYAYLSDGRKQYNNSASSFGNSYTTNDIIGIAMDLDNNKLYFSKNGTWQDSGDPTSGSSGTGSAYDLVDGVYYTFGGSSYDGGTDPQFSWNFGSPSFAISSGNADANGYGNFEYSVPSGYLALCTKNLGSDGG